MLISVLPPLSRCHGNECEISTSTYIEERAESNYTKRGPSALRSPRLRQGWAGALKGRGMQMELNRTSSQTEAGPRSQTLAVNSQSTPGKKGGRAGSSLSEATWLVLSRGRGECSSLCSIPGNTGRHNINLVRYANC